jgi:hypothetical protein
MDRARPNGAGLSDSAWIDIYIAITFVVTILVGKLSHVLRQKPKSSDTEGQGVLADPCINGLSAAKSQ